MIAGTCPWCIISTNGAKVVWQSRLLVCTYMYMYKETRLTHAHVHIYRLIVKPLRLVCFNSVEEPGDEAS